MSVLTNLIGQYVGKNRIKLVALLGEGSYGCVYRGIFRKDSVERHCAVKCMERSNLDAYHLMCQRREIVLHSQVSAAPGVVTLYDAFEEGDYQFIVMEYCPDGDLWEGIASGRYIGKDAIIKDIFIQVLESVEYCHAQGVFHRDIKPENILLSEGGRKVLLADFGLSTGSPVSNEMRCGSPWYMSPECWGGMNGLGKAYETAANDVWCLGILLINLACGCHAPWKQATRRDPFFRDYVKEPDTLRSLLPVSSELYELIARIFVTDPQARISVADLKTAIQGIKHFSIPPKDCRGCPHNQRETQNATVTTKPTHSLSIEAIEIHPDELTSSTPSFTDEDIGIDITDAIRDSEHFTGSNDSFIRNVTIIDTSPVAIQSASHVPSSPPSSLPSMLSSSESSVESDGPITPDFPATIANVEVSDIPDISQDISDALSDSVDKCPKSPNTKRPVINYRFQNILQAVGALVL